MTLFQEIQQAGIEYDHHATDLYLPDTLEVRAILDNHKLRYEGTGGITKFYATDGTGVWFDIPFSYDPGWEAWRQQLRQNTKGIKDGK